MSGGIKDSSIFSIGVSLRHNLDLVRKAIVASSSASNFFSTSYNNNNNQSYKLKTEYFQNKIKTLQPWVF